MQCAIAALPKTIDKDACRAFFVRHFHPSGAMCPYCGIAATGHQAETFAAGGRLRCNSCQRWYTYRTGTPLHEVKTEDSQVYLLLMMTAAGCAPEPIAAVCQIADIATVTSLQRRFLEWCG